MKTGKSLWLAIIPVWLVLGLGSASQFYASVPPASRPSFFTLVLWALLGLWSFWALLTPVIFRLGQRIPLRKENLARGIAIHAFLSIALSVVHIIVLSLISLRVFPPPSMSTSDEIWLSIRAYLTFEVFTYWALLGAGIAYHTSQLEGQLVKARLDALKMQVHPHFLFNALNTIAMLVRQGDQTRGVQLIAELGSLLRSSFELGATQEIPVTEEIDFIRRYLEIEHYRFPDRMKVEIDVPPEVSKAQIPALILQPLVENSIRHGLSRTLDEARIRIALGRSDGWLDLRVEDNGPGPGESVDKGLGVGLKNLRSRLHCLYGDEYELSLLRGGNGGAVSHIRIPFREMS
jgi:two-component system, LytTR family, sensor kinase